MLRATPIQGPNGPAVKLEGKLSGQWVDEMKRFWMNEASESRNKLRIDLREVSYIDGPGRELLLDMERQGARLVGASEFLSHLLREGQTVRTELQEKRSFHEH